MITKKLSVDWSTTGLDAGGTGALHYRVVDVNNADLIARTNVNVAEFPASSGSYTVKITTWNSTWDAEVIWDDGTTFYSERIGPVSGGGGGGSAGGRGIN